MISLIKQLFSPYVVRFNMADTLWVAFSGGIDSSVLVHALTLCPKIDQSKIILVHVNHGLSPDASQWARHCESKALEYGLPIIIKTVPTSPKQGESIEAFARDARYDLLATQMAKNDVLLVGHHQQDQAETLLLQLFRGAGPKGLSAMPVTKPFANGTLIRPLLNIDKKAINDYAQHYGLSTIEDNSNHDSRFDRNYIRHSVLPIIKDRWPTVNATIARASQHYQDQETVLDLLIHTELSARIDTPNQRFGLLECEKLNPLLLKRLLRAFVKQFTGVYPSAKALNVLLHEVIDAKNDRHPVLSLGALECRRFDGWLYLFRPVAPWSKAPICWTGDSSLSIPGFSGEITKARLKNEGLSVDVIDWTKTQIRFRQGGERCKIVGHNITKSLKKLMQECRIPPWIRERTPLLYEGNELKMVVGIGPCEMAKP